ncbi:YkvA family protein [Hymenobacter psychrotolerans]|uniref:Uncharacterized membrane protein YkvA, DUF1232 family n=1 Tax=Hymenobacter psychrotolerans DSM 18569 TaxID=1121959 RepID=A0A1M6P6B7_9BACT|nr:YkvA family protein [Hymenobacter psychrotolerans]SHK03432.1 Uncharacterized membrane protein YkvA, DUF1232 family [Hymenobacter psychrotolerans DSM 18569]
MDKQNPKGEHIAASPLFKKFVGKAEEYIKKPTRIKQLLNDAYQKASDKNDIGSLAQEAWETLQTLFRLIRASVSGEYTGLPTGTVVAAVAVTIYFMSPIDLIPDVIPVLGLLDDVALVAWFSTTIKEELDKFSEWEKTRPEVIEDAQVIEDDAPKAASKPSAQPKPAQATAPTDTPATPAASHADVAATTTDSSREPNRSADARPSGGDTGGNVR